MKLVDKILESNNENSMNMEVKIMRANIYVATWWQVGILVGTKLYVKPVAKPVFFSRVETPN